MGRITPAMIEKIRDTFKREPIVNEVARKCNVSEATVRKYVSSDNNVYIGLHAGKQSNASNQSNEIMNKAIYTELSKRQTPIQIIAKYGFSPDYVEAEYQRYNRINNTDMFHFQKRYIDGIESFIESDRTDLKSFMDMYKKRGYLTGDELLELVQKIAEG